MRLRLLLIVVALVISGVDAEAQDSSAGGALYKDVCKNCHGPTGKGMASFPKLVGSDSEHIVSRLKSYRAGEKIGPNTALMVPIAAELSDQDIDNLAAYITSELQ